MKLVTFVANGVERLGALATFNGLEEVIDLHKLDPEIPGDMLSFLEAGDRAMQRAHQALLGTKRGLILSSVTLKAPVPRPGKIMCIGLNYRDHAAESGAAIPEYPVVFAKYSTAVNAHGQPIVLPKVTSQVDYEAELGFVIGKQGRYISEREALSYVAGYLPANDVSARDYQMRVSQWTMGKNFDTFAPMGPALVTADEIPDPQSLEIQLTINGEVLQHSNTSHMIFNIAQLVAALSEVMTLNPGDVVMTGTPPGVGAARKPPRFLKADDEVSVTIQGLGTLTNKVVTEA